MEVFEVPVGRGVRGGQREHEELMRRVQHELGVVRKAGGIHARNYHVYSLPYPPEHSACLEFGA